MTMRPARRERANGHDIAERVRAALGYLSCHASPSGRFDGVDGERTEPDSAAYDVLAHAGATAVLYRLVGSRFADAALDATAERAFSYLRNRLAPVKCRECRVDHGTRFVDGGIARLGSTALALLALAARIDRSGSAGSAGSAGAATDDMRLLIQLARYLTSQQDEDGRFVAGVDTTTGERAPSPSPRDSGMAVLALCAAYRIAGQAEHGEGAVRGARHLVGERPAAGDDGGAAALAPPDPWLMRALAELHVLAPDAIWVVHLRALAAPVIAAAPPTEPDDAVNPACLHARTTAQVAACLEGLLAGFAVERRLGERARAASVLRVILAGLEHCHAPPIGAGIGLEEVQHTLAASFGLLQLLAGGGAPGARAAADRASLSRKRRSAGPSSPKTDEPARRLVAHRVVREPLLSIVPGVGDRDWMEATMHRFANRCLPLRIANQAGWVFSLPEPFELEWSGAGETDQVSVFASDRMRQVVGSYFGHGIVTFQTQLLFRTEPGYNLLVRGPANLPKDGISPLEGIVETDWTAATFTMNWQITRPLHRIGFAAGEPIGMLVPVRRGELESFAPELHRLNDDPELASRYFSWRNGRRNFIRAMDEGEQAALRAGWQRDYMLGRDPRSETAASQHQTKLLLRPFLKTWQD
jgi:hypothetical protein